MTVESRQKCKKCRYDKCLKSGMNPDAILSEDQKEIRFRKTLTKKRILAGQQNVGQEQQVPATNPEAVTTVVNFQLSHNPVLFNSDQSTVGHIAQTNLGPESHSTLIHIPDNQIFLTTSLEESKRPRVLNYLVPNLVPNMSSESSTSLPSSSGLSLRQLPHLVPVNSFVFQPPVEELQHHRYGQKSPVNHLAPKIESILASYNSSLMFMNSNREMAIYLSPSKPVEETRKWILRQKLFSHFAQLSQQFKNFAFLLRFVV